MKASKKIAVALVEDDAWVRENLAREINKRTFHGEILYGTDPLKPDTDGDGLLDGKSVALTSADPRYNDWPDRGIAFSDNGSERIFRGEITMSTDPLKKDTDGDALLDGVESNTGIFVGPNNTGSNPLSPDADGDGAGDWYEVYAAFTDPNVSVNKPVAPYPLPPPTGTVSTNKPVKVFILSGQSNMVGFGRIAGSKPGTLETMVKRERKFPHLLDGTNWMVRSDVLYRGVVSAPGNDYLSPKFGAETGSYFGPELGFGQIMAGIWTSRSC